MIPQSILRQTNEIVYSKVEHLTDSQQSSFLSEFVRKRKSIGIAYVLWFFLGLHYAYLGKWGIQIVYWITLGGFFIWAFVDLFRIPSLVRDFNADLSTEVLKDVIVIG